MRHYFTYEIVILCCVKFYNTVLRKRYSNVCFISIISLEIFAITKLRTFPLKPTLVPQSSNVLTRVAIVLCSELFRLQCEWALILHLNRWAVKYPSVLVFREGQNKYIYFLYSHEIPIYLLIILHLEIKSLYRKKSFPMMMKLGNLLRRRP